jgi:hypothetical protein
MQRLTLNTLSKDDATRALQAAESQDFYYSRMDEINRKARRYPYLVSSMNSPSQMPFEVPTAIPFKTKSVSIVLLEPSSDNGLPHTRGTSTDSVICLPHFYAWKPNPTTTLHELVHISQKQEPERWWRWYGTKWKFAKLEDASRVPEKWRGLARRNPDTLDSPLVVWNERYVPLTVYTNSFSPDLQETQRGFYDLQRGAWMWETPSGWDSMFGSGFNDEHPHEIAAHWIDGSGGAERQKYFNLNPV